jgi:hypothetical protein
MSDFLSVFFVGPIQNNLTPRFYEQSPTDLPALLFNYCINLKPLADVYL